MRGDPFLLFCGFFCLYPLIVFGIPAFFIGRFWGRIKLQAPISLRPGIKGAPAPKGRDVAGFGKH